MSLAGRAGTPRLRPSTPVPGTIIGLDEFSSISRFSSVESMTSCLIRHWLTATSASRRDFENVLRQPQAFVDDPLDFLVDLAGRLLAVVLHPRHVRADHKRAAIAFAIVDAAQPTHAEIHHHAAGDFGRPLEVVLRAARHVVEDHFFGHRAAQEHLDAALELALGHQEAVLLGPLHRVAQSSQDRGE